MAETEQEFELRHPPVVEAVLGIQFLPLARWSIPHFGLFWSKIRKEYPHYQVQDPVLTPEALTGPMIGPLGPMPRLWFLDESGQRVLQLQNDRIVINWRKQGPAPYPRYRAMRTEMESLWPLLVSFLEEEGIGSPQKTRCEHTYVNHVDLRSLLSEGDQFADLFSFWRGGPSDFLIEGQGQSFQNTTVMPTTSSVLTVSFQPVVNMESNKVLWQLTFTAVTSSGSAEVSSVLAAADTSHALDVRAFKEFTSEKAHAKWNREDPA